MWVKKIARMGCLTKGFVYFMLSVLVFKIAIDGSRTTDEASTSGALEAISLQPFGKFLLSIVAIGLMGYAMWRFLEAFLDPDRPEQNKNSIGIFVRIGYTLSGLSYMGLSVSAIKILLKLNKDSNNSPSDWTVRLLSLPFGQWIVGAIGMAAIGVGGTYLHRSIRRRSKLHLDLAKMENTIGTEILYISRFGIAARGFIFCLVGFFLLRAAMLFDPNEARGLDESLRVLARQPFGQVILAIVALGLVAYSIHMLVEAKYRQMKTLEKLASDLKTL